MSKIKNERNVLIETPGRAYMDGRDFAAQPPLTVGGINLWTGTGRRARTAGSVLHGCKVQVVRHVHKRYRDWFLIRYQPAEDKPALEGWVLGCFLNVEQYPPIGDFIV